MNVVLTVFPGLLLLVGGLYIMRLGLGNTFSTIVREPIKRLTKTPWRGTIAGMGAAALMQSSTAVTLCAIGLVSAGFLTFEQSIGLILGANIGTCTTVQLLTLSLPTGSLEWLLAVCAGAAILLPRLRFIILAFCGIISMFCGLNLLSDGLKDAAELDTVISLLSLAGENPLYGITGGMMLTFAVQSSSAATGLMMMLFQEGLINLTTAIYGVYGNNIGSCLSSLLVATAAPPEAKRVAVAHFALNLLGVMAFFPFSNIIAKATTLITSDFAGQVAFVHTLFNIVSSLLILPVIGPFSRLIIFLVPGKSAGR